MILGRQVSRVRKWKAVFILVLILTGNFLKLSRSKHSDKISMDFELLKVFKFHMEHEAKP